MSDPEIDVLLVVRLKGLAEAEQVAGRVGSPPARVRDVLTASVESGWVIRRDGHTAGYQLTERGRGVVEAALYAELTASGARQHVEALYNEFVGLNRRFLQLCTDWQLVAGNDPPLINDHADVDYDTAVLDRLRDQHRVALDLDARLGARLVRLGGYGPRLDEAWQLIEAGEMRWLLSPAIDSYHTVWMEWHQHLLSTLGRKRSDDTVPSDVRSETEMGGEARGPNN